MTSQRGLSGTKNSMTKYRTDGSASMPSIQRHAASPCTRGASQPSLLSPSLQDEVVAQECGRDADHDIELVDRHHPAAQRGRRHLGDVHGRDDQRRADAEAADHSRDDQPKQVRRHRREYGRDGEQERGQRSTGRRPNRSLNGPAHSIAIVAVSVREATAQPSSILLSPKRGSMKVTTPEITDASNPMRKPPKPTQSAILSPYQVPGLTAAACRLPARSAFPVQRLRSRTDSRRTSAGSNRLRISSPSLP